MSRPFASWLVPPRPATTEFADPAARRLVGTEILVVLTATLGLSALRSALALLNALLQPVPLSSQQVALNAPVSEVSVLDLAFQLVGVLQLSGGARSGRTCCCARGSRCARSGSTRGGPAETRSAPPCSPR